MLADITQINHHNTGHQKPNHPSQPFQATVTPFEPPPIVNWAPPQSNDPATHKASHHSQLPTLDVVALGWRLLVDTLSQFERKKMREVRTEKKRRKKKIIDGEPLVLGPNNWGFTTANTVTDFVVSLHSAYSQIWCNFCFSRVNKLCTLRFFLIKLLLPIKNNCLNKNEENAEWEIRVWKIIVLNYL